MWYCFIEHKFSDAMTTKNQNFPQYIYMPKIVHTVFFEGQRDFFIFFLNIYSYIFFYIKIYYLFIYKCITNYNYTTVHFPTILCVWIKEN